jgi:hypothetical protein
VNPFNLIYWNQRSNKTEKAAKAAFFHAQKAEKKIMIEQCGRTSHEDSKESLFYRPTGSKLNKTRVLSRIKPTNSL